MISVESTELKYEPLPIDNELFTARVYKRNYRVPAKSPSQRPLTENSLVVVSPSDLAAPDKFLKDMVSSEPGWSTIHTVARKGDVRFMDVLLARGANVNDITEKEHWKPLHLAAQNGDLPMARLLVSKGADISRTSSSEEEPI